MESALVPAAGIPPQESQQIILPTEEERKRLEALADVKALHERTKPLLVMPSDADSYTFPGKQLTAIRVAKKTLLGLWRPYVDELLKKKTDAYNQMMEGAKLMDELEAKGDKLVLDYDRITREAAQRQQASVQQVVNNQAQEEAQSASYEQTMALAIEADAAGNHELAEQILNTETPAPAVMPVTVVLQTQTPKLEGFSKRVTWKGRLKGSDADNPVPPASFELLIKAVAEDLSKPIDQRRGLVALLKVNDTALSAMAKAMKAQFNVPGCESYEDVGLAKRV